MRLRSSHETALVMRIGRSGWRAAMAGEGLRGQAGIVAAPHRAGEQHQGRAALVDVGVGRQAFEEGAPQRPVGEEVLGLKGVGAQGVDLVPADDGVQPRGKARRGRRPPGGAAVAEDHGGEDLLDVDLAGE